MATTRFARRPVFAVTRVEIANAHTGETFSIPGMRVTVAQIRAMIACPGTANVLCDACGESIADCPDLRDRVAVPAAWSWRQDA